MSKEKRQFKYEKNITESLKILEVTISALNKHNIDYYLDFGTLIGAIRDKGFISWDDDMDISLVNESDYKKIPEVLKDIKELNFRIYLDSFKDSIKKRELNAQKLYHSKIKFTDENNYRVAKIRNNRFWIFGKGPNCLDIFFKYKHQDQISWVAQGKAHSLPKDKISDELIEIDFYHLKCKVPKNYDEYLTSMYGDWQTPKENWQYYEHDTCPLKD